MNEENKRVVEAIEANKKRCENCKKLSCRQKKVLRNHYKKYPTKEKKAIEQIKVRKK